MKKDIDKYLASMYVHVEKMKTAAEKAVEMAQNGEISQEQLDNICNYFDAVQSNYNRVLYCKQLMMRPPEFIVKLRNKHYAKLQKKFAEQKADQLSVENENRENITAAEEIVNK